MYSGRVKCLLKAIGLSEKSSKNLAKMLNSLDTKLFAKCDVTVKRDKEFTRGAHVITPIPYIREL